MVPADHEDNLTDSDLQLEIELVGDLVVAASASEGPLPQDEVDQLLGVRPVSAPAVAPCHEAGSAPRT
jgi:hypothetical protein